MTLISWLLSVKTVSGALVIVVFWFVTKFLDGVLIHFGLRRVVSPAIRYIKLTIRSKLSILSPINIRYEFSFGIRDTVTVKTAKSDLSSLLDSLEEKAVSVSQQAKSDGTTDQDRSR